MSEESNIESIRVAAIVAAKSKKAFQISAALDAVPAAPLRATILELLERIPGIQHRKLLIQLAELNQGRLDDLDSPEFRSYLIRKLQTDEQALMTCVRSISTYYRVASAAGSDAEGALAAARSEDDTGARASSASDILRELKRRK
jgi:hypothetical protein